MIPTTTTVTNYAPTKIGCGNFKIIIFNRWGGYTSTDPFFEWDGTHKGNKCTVGTYVFYIVAIGEDNTPFKRTGHVYLVR